MQKPLFIALFLVFSLYLTSPISQAVEEATSPGSINEVTENIKERLQESLEENNSDNTTKLTGYVGKVKDIIKSTLIIEDKEGKKNVLVSSDTTITRTPGNAVIKIDSIRIDDYVIAIGTLGQTELVGKKLIVSSTSFDPPTKISGIGVIDKIGKATVSITSATGTTELEINAKTVTKSLGGLIEYTDLSVGDQLVYAGTDNKGDLTATVLLRTKSAK